MDNIQLVRVGEGIFIKYPDRPAHFDSVDRSLWVDYVILDCGQEHCPSGPTPHVFKDGRQVR